MFITSVCESVFWASMICVSVRLFFLQILLGLIGWLLRHPVFICRPFSWKCWHWHFWALVFQIKGKHSFCWCCVETSFFYSLVCFLNSRNTGKGRLACLCVVDSTRDFDLGVNCQSVSTPTSCLGGGGVKLMSAIRGVSNCFNLYFVRLQIALSHMPY